MYIYVYAVLSEQLWIHLQKSQCTWKKPELNISHGLLLTCFILTFSPFLLCSCKGMGIESVQLGNSTCSVLPLSGAWSHSAPLLPLSGTQGLSGPSMAMLWAAGSACVHFCSSVCFSIWKACLSTGVLLVNDETRYCRVAILCNYDVANGIRRVSKSHSWGEKASSYKKKK